MKKKKSRQKSGNDTLAGLLEEMKQDKVRFIIIAVSFIVFVVLLLYMSPFSFILGGPDVDSASAGSIAERDYILEKDVVYIDQEATRLKREAEMGLVPPVFSVNEEITQSILNNFRDFSEIMIRYGGDEADLTRMFLEIQAALPGIFKRSQIEYLISAGDLYQLMDICERTITYCVNSGILREQTVQSMEIPGSVEIRRWFDGRSESTLVSPDDVITLENIEEKIGDFFDQKELPGELFSHVSMVMRGFLEVNTFFDNVQTENNRQKVRRDVQPVIRKIPAGDFIIREGETITREDVEKISTLETYSRRATLYNVCAILIFLALIYGLTIFLFRPPLYRGRISTSQLAILVASFFLFVLTAVLVDRFVHLQEWMPFSLLLPTIFFTVLLTVLINPRTGFIFTLISSLSLFVITHLNPVSFQFSFFAGISALMLTKNAEKRIDMLRAILIHSLLCGIIMLMIVLQKQVEPRIFPRALGFGIAAGFVNGMLHLGIIPLLEHILNIPSRFRLFELADTNAPPLKKMLITAPGTYSHSLNVANLAEAAAKEIGANWLLARVGAYYHDIGKTEQPEYFVENQKDVNKLNELNPSLSVAVIKSHVKLGIEKAKKLRLPRAVIDVISQHHGSGLISYFYNEALKDGKSSTSVNKQDFSYSEPIPETREAAVVMLADTVDAAVRTLKKPSVPKLEKFIWDLFMVKIRERQFSNCELTMKDLEVIKNIFVHILSGYFHGRIEYPRNDGEDNEQG